MSQTVRASAAPAAIGPYSQAVVSGNLIFTSGQIPLDPQTGEVVGDDIRTQTEQIMRNLSAVLAAACTSLDRAVKITCYLADMADFAVFNEVYATYVKNAPARSCVAVRALPRGVLAEVEVIAEL